MSAVDGAGPVIGPDFERGRRGGAVVDREWAGFAVAVPVSLGMVG